MTAVAKRIPKLRFKEFSGEWQDKKLGDLITFKNGKAHEQAIDSNGEFIVINSKYISTEGRTRKFAMSQIEPVYKNDIVMVMSDVPKGKAIAKCLLVDSDKKYTLNQRICALTAINGYSPRFIFYCINRNAYYLGFDNGVSQTNLRKVEVLSCPIVVPQLLEQQKIAKFLTSVDQHIELQDKRVKLLQKYKKGVMQKIFSQQIRFKDDNFKNYPGWLEKKLSDFLEINTSSSKSQYIDQKGKNVIVDMGAISSDATLIKTKKTNYNHDFLCTNELVMAKDDIGGGNIIGKVVTIPSEKTYVCGDHVYRLTEINAVVKYIYYVINSYEINKSFRRKANGTAQIGINNNTVNEQTVPLPYIKEQQKIADFLTSVDDKIDLEKNKLKQAKKIKKALLQRMFV